MRTFPFNGQKWNVETTGTSHDVMGMGSMGAWFWLAEGPHDDMSIRTLGEISLVGLDNLTDEQLADALSKALKEKAE